MGYINALRERSALVRAVTKYLGSVFFPLTFALFCVLTGSNGKEVYVPLTIVMLMLVLLAAVFADDNKVLLAPMLMGYYCIGVDDASLFEHGRNDPLVTFDLGAFTVVCICGALAALAIVARLYLDGTLKTVFKRRGICFYGILALDAVFLLNGLFSEKWVPMNLVYGAMIAFGITVFYLIASAILHSSSDPIPYLAKSMVATSYIAVLQVIPKFIDAYQSGKLVIEHNKTGELIFNHKLIQLGWGFSTIIGAVIVLGIPAAMYLAKNRRYAPLSLGSAVIFLCFAAIVNARSAILVGAVFFILGAICICGGKNRIINRVFVAGLALSALGAAIYIHFNIKPIGEIVEALVDILRFDELRDSARIELWSDGWSDFVSSPVFGVGIDDGAYTEAKRFENVFSNMYHSIFVQFIASMGIVGFAAFAIHVKDLCVVAFRRFSIDRLLILSVPLMIIAMSIVDNFFFYLNFQIIYAIFLALAERALRDKEEPAPQE